MSYARPKVIGDKDVRAWIKSRQEKGKDDPNTAAYLAKQLEKGNALGAKAANTYAEGDYDTQKQRYLRYHGIYGGTGSFARAAGKDVPASIAGLSGLKLSKGDVYLGSSQRDVPGSSRRDPKSGLTQVPGRTEYYPTVARRSDFVSRFREAPKDSDSEGSGEAASVEPSNDLLAAREAYDRANAYSSSSRGPFGGGSFASPLDLSKTGGDLFNAIAADAERQRDWYDNTFVNKLLANANLTAQEIGYAGQSAIANLPKDLKLPEYSKIFPDRAQRKGGLYKWLEGRIA